jgi:hypothetical protein
MSNKAASGGAKSSKVSPPTSGRGESLMNPHRSRGGGLIKLSCSPAKSLITFCHRAFLVRAVLIRGSYVAPS